MSDEMVFGGAKGYVLGVGLDVGEHQTKLLQKIEALTLYLLELDKKVAAQAQLIAEQAKQLQTLRK
jgi:sigma54-dependent transcription regulator